MPTISIFREVCLRQGLKPDEVAATVSERGARIFRHYQRWYDRSKRTRFDYDYATHRCIGDLAGANHTPNRDQRTEIRL